MVELAKFNRKTTLAMVNSRKVPTKPRTYLGMSAIGHPCSRYLWYSFRWCYKADTIPARLARLFDRGHREEPCIVKELEHIGIKCHSDQAECESAWGHVKGHCDGMADNVPEAPKTTHLLEFKTMNDKAFKDINKKGLKESKPIYYAQVQLYMRKLKLTRALFISVNKNDDNWYVERVELDKGYADTMLSKAKDIVLATHPPIAPYKPTWYLCKWCDACDICHHNVPFEVSCRSCKYSEPALEGAWTCNYHEDDPENLTVKIQRIGCADYETIK